MTISEAEKILKTSKYSDLLEVTDIETLDGNRGIYFVWLKLPGNVSVKALISKDEEKNFKIC